MKKLFIKILLIGACASLLVANLFLVNKIKNASTEVMSVQARYDSDTAALSKIHSDLLIELKGLYVELEQKDQEIVRLNELVESFKTDVNIGEFTITAYSPFDDVSGIESDGNPNATSTGMTPGPHVIAVDPTVIPYYSNVLIIYPDGNYLLGLAGDCGGAIKGNKLDIYKDTYAETVDFGVQNAKVVWW